MTQTWELWFPEAAATGLLFARTRIDGAAVRDGVLVHAAPPQLDVVVRDEDGAVLAQASGLERTAPGPMTVLRRKERELTLADVWPEESDLGRLVILSGGEAGVLTSWWHAEDKSEWRWQLELYNHT